MIRTRFKHHTLYYAGGVAAIMAVMGLFAFFAGPNLSTPSQLAKAGGITPTISPEAQSVNTTANIDISYTTSADMNPGSTITLYYNVDYIIGTNGSDFLINGIASSAVSSPVATSANTEQVVITLANTVTAGNTVTLSLVNATTPITAGNYALAITSSVNDYGGNFQYVGELNVVEVRAFIPLRLSFGIRNSSDTADTNICDLGQASTLNIAECEYRLKVSTNAQNGYTISMSTDGDLSNGTYGISNAAAGPTGTAISAGTETYGVFIEPGSITGSGVISTLPAYTTSSTNVVNYSSTVPANIIESTGPNATVLNTPDTTNSSLVTHKLAIDDNTPTGEYTQRITYKVAPTF